MFQAGMLVVIAGAVIRIAGSFAKGKKKQRIRDAGYVIALVGILIAVFSLV